MDLREFRALRRPPQAWEGFDRRLRTAVRRRRPAWAWAAAAAAVLAAVLWLRRPPQPVPGDWRVVARQRGAVAVRETLRRTPGGEAVAWVDVYLEEDVHVP